jgi:hypothetical protein
MLIALYSQFMLCVLAVVSGLLLGSNSRQLGRAIAQTVSRRLPTAAARVQNRVWSCGIL